MDFLTMSADIITTISGTSEDILATISQDAVGNITIMAGITNTVNSISQYMTQDVITWIVEHKDWLIGAFSGIGLVAWDFFITSSNGFSPFAKEESYKSIPTFTLP